MSACLPAFRNYFELKAEVAHPILLSEPQLGYCGPFSCCVPVAAGIWQPRPPLQHPGDVLSFYCSYAAGRSWVHGCMDLSWHTVMGWIKPSPALIRAPGSTAQRLELAPYKDIRSLAETVNSRAGCSVSKQLCCSQTYPWRQKTCIYLALLPR